jgi:hypothetical protein
MNRIHRYEYLLSVLPALELIGSIPPMSKRELLERIIDTNGPVDSVEVLLLGDDLIQYEALLAEEIKQDEIDLAVISLDKAESEPVLPDFLLPEEGAHEQESKRISVDEMWSRYFRHAAYIAKRAHSGFLKAWIGFEVGLRNALVTARAHILELDSAAYLVAPQLADQDTDYSYVSSAWSSASNPLNALEVLDKARWEWLEENGKWYSFAACEIEVYAAKLMLLHRWRRILSDKKQRKQTDVVQV